jgi:hypothetical protein
MLTRQLRCVRSLENEAVSVFEIYSTLRTITIRQLYATPDGLEIVKLPRNSIGSLPQNRPHLTGVQNLDIRKYHGPIENP